MIENAAKILIECYKNRGKTLICGNGGSASQAEHFASELVGRFKKERKAIPSIALTGPSAVITAIANDYGYDNVFSRQVEAFGNENDVLIVLTTSGNSQNLIEAVNKAKEKGIKTIALLGKDGGKLKGMCDIEIIDNSEHTAQIQEAHLRIIHTLCEMIDDSIEA